MTVSTPNHLLRLENFSIKPCSRQEMDAKIDLSNKQNSMLIQIYENQLALLIEDERDKSGFDKLKPMEITYKGLIEMCNHEGIHGKIRLIPTTSASATRVAEVCKELEKLNIQYDI